MTEHIGAAPLRARGAQGPPQRLQAEDLEDAGGHAEPGRARIEGAFSTRLFCRYQRNEKALVLALMEMYVEGVSTREGQGDNRRSLRDLLLKEPCFQPAGGLDSSSKRRSAG